MLTIMPCSCLLGMSTAGAKKVAFGANINMKFKGMPSKHAEMDAINKIKTKKNLPKKMDMFVIRITKTGLLSESRPCLHCLKALEKSKLKIRYIFYSKKQGFIREKFKYMKDSPLTYISSGIRTRS